MWWSGWTRGCLGGPCPHLGTATPTGEKRDQRQWFLKDGVKLEVHEQQLYEARGGLKVLAFSSNWNNNNNNNNNNKGESAITT